MAHELEPHRFRTCWRALGAADDRVFDEICKRYAEAHRTYHNGEHIKECLAWCDRLAVLVDRPEELEVAIYFHDLVYEPTQQDNEHRSAALFAQAASAAGVHHHVRDRITALILSTASHDGEGDSALLNDIDLSVLGSSPARFARYEACIRTEYNAVPDAQYQQGRARVLEGFLERLVIFRTGRMAALLEVQARDNLARALDALRA